jgi:phosphatidylserine/phosphatidylglycerophosphate/cardiolipin synthase-like enzyme
VSGKPKAAFAMSADIERVIDRNLKRFDRPRVLSVRPGYEITRGWLTGRPAIVVTVSRKLRRIPDGEQLPDEVQGVPVDVRQASARKRKELLDPRGYASELRLSPDRGSVPHFPQERRLDGTRPAAEASAHAVLAAATKPELDYTAPAGASLAPLEVTATVQLSASPDSGWSTLSAFLAATQSALTVGMYDCTSAHVLAALTDALADGKLTLTLDHPPLDKTADQTDADTVAALQTALGDRLTQAWALTKLDPEATAWIYPTSYHIKVAVRDGKAMWLSSGNWNNSNQPAIDPVTAGLGSSDADEARHRDRDWHVVITHGKLSQLFRSYLTNDRSVAAGHNGPPEAAGPPLPEPKLPSTETPAFQQFFAATSFHGRMKIAPVLTPDPGSYAATVTQLIQSATTSLYLQFQYIELPKTIDATSQAFVDLVDAVIAQQDKVDLRIVMSQYESSGYLEQLQARGLDVVNKVKIQNNVHNKGIVVDDSAVLVSSQNWSTDGALYNRDAGVVIYDQRAATYFQQIFLHDWDHLAHQRATSD